MNTCSRSSRQALAASAWRLFCLQTARAVALNVYSGIITLKYCDCFEGDVMKTKGLLVVLMPGLGLFLLNVSDSVFVDNVSLMNGGRAHQRHEQRRKSRRQEPGAGPGER